MLATTASENDAVVAVTSGPDAGEFVTTSPENVFQNVFDFFAASTTDAAPLTTSAAAIDGEASDVRDLNLANEIVAASSIVSDPATTTADGAAAGDLEIPDDFNLGQPSESGTTTIGNENGEAVIDGSVEKNDNASSTEESVTPTIDEQSVDSGKIITVSAPENSDGTPVTNLPVRTEVPELFKIGQEDKIKIKWINNDDQEMQFTAFDEDRDGFIDHVEWVVPHLSTQTFAVIYISKALQLDADKNFVADIFDLVKSQDGNYASLGDGQFVRVTFESALDNSRDITLYAKSVSGAPAKIEVYAQSGELVATFDNIGQTDKYRVLLTNLTTPGDTFDLKIIGGADIDYIVDPTTRYWVAGGNGNWSSTSNWSASSGGASGASIPDSATDVVFNDSSGAGPSTIDNSFTIGSLAISGYTGTITQNASLAITNAGGCSGSYSQTSAATFSAINPGSNTFSVTGNFSVTSGAFRRYSGSGTGNDPYLVYDIYGLQGMKTGLANFYKLNNDINASTTSSWNSGAGFIPVGDATNNFTGDFDGDGHTISNLYINSTTLNYVGLFGYSINSIENVTLESASTTAVGVAGANGNNGANGTDGTSTSNGGNGTAGSAASTPLYLGGLVGYNLGSITNVSVTGSITGAGGAGGRSGDSGRGGNINSGTSAAGSGGTSQSGGAGAAIYAGGLAGYSLSGN
ncbi:MAG: hypothetical protein MUD10_05375, partial [Candidatus Pacebacteria bacterium]|nr:hypothetical protein [Candidatus Paceibacterota bacterium]